MKKQYGPVIFFGNERLATGVSTSTPVLEALLNNGYQIELVVSNFTNSSSRNARHLEIERITNQYKIPLLLPNKLSDIKDRIIRSQANIGILVAYGKLIPNDIIELFSRGIVNIHPSLLPKYRGPTPLEQIILDGSNITGVSLMKLVKEMDAGPIYAQKEIVLSGAETKQELADTLLISGRDMLIENLPDIISGSKLGIEQDNASATYTKLINKDDGIVDWNKSALTIEREVRAFKNWPRSRAYLANKNVIITQVKVVNTNGTPGAIHINDNKHLLVNCGEQSIEILELVVESKSKMSGVSFISGYKDYLIDPS